MKLTRVRALASSPLLALGAATAAASAQPTSGATSAGAAPTPFKIDADVVAAKPDVQGQGCVNQSVFFPGDQIVWRARIVDARTGASLDTPQAAAERGLTVIVTLGDGTTVPLHVGVHPPPQANAAMRTTYWSGHLDLAQTHPTGTLPWTLTVSDREGRSARFVPIGQEIGLAVLTVAAKGAAGSTR